MVVPSASAGHSRRWSHTRASEGTGSEGVHGPCADAVERSHRQIQRAAWCTGQFEPLPSPLSLSYRSPAAAFPCIHELPCDQRALNALTRTVTPQQEMTHKTRRYPYAQIRRASQKLKHDQQHFVREGFPPRPRSLLRLCRGAGGCRGGAATERARSRCPGCAALSKHGSW